MAEVSTSDKIIKVMSAIFEQIGEIHAIMPDSLLFGSLLLYMITQNVPFGIFTIFIFESMLSHKLISWIMAQSVGPSRSIDVKCRAGYKTPNVYVSRMFSHDPYPSYSVFTITSVATYLGLATKEFSDTIHEMGPKWEGRATVAYTFIGLFLLTFIISRSALCNDTTGEIAIAFVLAILTGLGFFYLNKTLFGIESMNFLGLPYMISKESQGSDIYLCSKEE